MIKRSPLTVAIGGMVIMAVVMGIGRFVYTPILPFMTADGVIDRAEAGLIAGSNFLGYLIGALAAGSARLRSDRRRIMYAGLFASLVTTAAMAWSVGFNAMVAVRFASGLASAFAMIFISSIVFDLARQTEKPHLSAIQFSGVGLGITVSAATIAILSLNQDQTPIEWQTLWLVAAALSAFGILIGWLGVGGPGAGARITGSLSQPTSQLKAGSNAQKPALSGPASGGALVWLIFGYGLFGYGYIITATFISEMAASVPQLQSTQNSVWLVVGLAAFLLTYPFTLLSNRLGNLQAYAVCCALEAVGVGLSVLILHPAALLVSAVLLGATFITITVLGLRAATVLITKIKLSGSASMFSSWDERIAVALMTASFGTGQVLGPIIAGLLFEARGNLTLASMTAVAALFVSGAIAAILSRKGE